MTVHDRPRTIVEEEEQHWQFSFVRFWDKLSPSRGNRWWFARAKEFSASLRSQSRPLNEVFRKFSANDPFAASCGGAWIGTLVITLLGAFILLKRFRPANVFVHYIFVWNVFPWPTRHEEANAASEAIRLVIIRDFFRVLWHYFENVKLPPIIRYAKNQSNLHLSNNAFAYSKGNNQTKTQNRHHCFRLIFQHVKVLARISTPNSYLSSSKIKLWWDWRGQVFTNKRRSWR